MDGRSVKLATFYTYTLTFVKNGQGIHTGDPRPEGEYCVWLYGVQPQEAGGFFDFKALNWY